MISQLLKNSVIPLLLCGGLIAGYSIFMRTGQLHLDETSLANHEQLAVNRDPVQGLCDSANSEVVYVRTTHRGVFALSTEDFRCVTASEIPTENLVRFSQSADHSTSVAGYADGAMRIFANQQLSTVSRNDRNQPITSVACAPNGRYAACVLDEQVIQIWTIPDRRLLHEIDSSPGTINSLAFSPDGQLLVSAESDGISHQWDARTGIVQKRCCWANRTLLTVAFSPDGKMIATGGRPNALQLADTATGELIWSPQVECATVLAVAFSPEGHQIACCGEQDFVQIFDIPRRKEIARLRGHRGAVRGLAFGNDGTILYTGGTDGTLRAWSCESHRELHRLNLKVESSTSAGNARYGS